MRRNIKPLAGVACYDDEKLKYLLLAGNNDGFREINDFLSEINIKGLTLPERAPEFEAVFVIYPMDLFHITDKNYQIPNPKKIRDSEETQNRLVKHGQSQQSALNTEQFKKPSMVSQLRSNEFIAVRYHELNKLLTSPIRHYPQKLLAWHNATFADAKDYELHRHLRAIDNNCLLSKLSPAQLANPNEIFITEAEAQQQFGQYPQLVNNAKKLTRQCELDFDFISIKNKKTFTSSRYDDRILLEKLALDGLAYRYGSEHKEALRRIKHELEIIDKLGFSAYFLITWDIIRYSVSRGFYHVGRGSGANSIVAYCLRITDVDPIALDLHLSDL